MKPKSYARMPEMRVIGISLRTKYEDMTVSREISNFWQRFYEEKVFEKIPHKSVPNRIIALYTDYDQQGNCTLVLGAQVTHYDIDTMPNGVVFKTIPAAHYALFSSHGALKQIVPALWQHIWQDRKLQRTFAHDFELYDMPVNINDATVEIYVGIHGQL